MTTRSGDGKEMVVDKMMIGGAYLNALRTGDRNFSRAIETAPKAFPLVTDTTINEGLEIKVELSSQAPDIKAIEGVRRTLNLVIKTAENGIKKIGQDRRFLPRF